MKQKSLCEVEPKQKSKRKKKNISFIFDAPDLVEPEDDLAALGEDIFTLSKSVNILSQQLAELTSLTAFCIKKNMLLYEIVKRMDKDIHGKHFESPELSDYLDN